jgi:hypothetical protein
MRAVSHQSTVMQKKPAQAAVQPHFLPVPNRVPTVQQTTIQPLTLANFLCIANFLLITLLLIAYTNHWVHH